MREAIQFIILHSLFSIVDHHHHHVKQKYETNATFYMYLLTLQVWHFLPTVYHRQSVGPK